MKQLGLLLVILICTFAWADSGAGGDHGSGQPVDPGPRGAPVSAGAPIAGLTSDQLAFFADGAARFNDPDTVSSGLGPTFNADFCGTCHSQPAEGGTSPSTTAYPFVGPNPQVALASAHGATNTLPSFIALDGPVREARFPHQLNRDGSVNQNLPDNGVHDLYTIAGRDDAPGCQMSQPDFARGLRQGNVIFRIPTPVFGAGLIEAIDEATSSPMRAPTPDRRSLWGSLGSPTARGTTGRSRGSGGRRRTSLSRYSAGRLITSRLE